MRVYDLHDEEGRIFAFEVKNFFLQRRGVFRIVSRIPGSRIVGEPSFSWFGPDTFCRFEVDGVEFEAWEPFGDSDTLGRPGISVDSGLGESMKEKSHVHRKQTRFWGRAGSP
jgi:hypothetical protein